MHYHNIPENNFFSRLRQYECPHLALSEDWATCFHFCLVRGSFTLRLEPVSSAELILWSLLHLHGAPVISTKYWSSYFIHYAGCRVIPVILVDKRWICEFCLKHLQASRLQPDLLQAERLVWRQSSRRRRGRRDGKTSETFQQRARAPEQKKHSEKKKQLPFPGSKHWVWKER